MRGKDEGENEGEDEGDDEGPAIVSSTSSSSRIMKVSIEFRVRVLDMPRIGRDYDHENCRSNVPWCSWWQPQ